MKQSGRRLRPPQKGDKKMSLREKISDIEYITDQLDDLIPYCGACEFPRSKNKALDKYRRATNAIHDFFYNDLRRHRVGFVRIFGDAPYVDSYKYFSSVSWRQWEEMIEPKFRQIIMDAAEEQGIRIEPTYLDLYA